MGRNLQSGSRPFSGGRSVASLLRGLAQAPGWRRMPAGCGSRIAEGPWGPIEYATRGAGTPVLAVHGAGGGWDHGLAMAGTFFGDGFSCIAPSRFGYRRTPLPADASVRAQAAAYACLLDSLDVPSAVVVGHSAGAPSCLQFALQYPERTEALVLLAPALYAPGPRGRPQGLHGALAAAGLPLWLAARANPFGILAWLLAASPAATSCLAPQERVRLGRLVQEALPVRARMAGMLADARAMRFRKRFPLERIGVPTLVMSARNDPYATYAAAEHTAVSMPEGRFVGFERGGHSLAGHEEEIRSAVAVLVRHGLPHA